MRKSKVVLDFIKFPVPVKIEFSRNVVTRMTGNTALATPDVPLATVTTAINTLETDYTASKTGAHALVAKMHQSEKALDDLLRRQAQYVDRIASGNEAIILGSGFGISKQPTPAQHPEFRVEHGANPGEILLTRKAVDGAKSYTWQYNTGELPTDDKGWVFAGTSTKATYQIKGLAPGSKCWFRVSAVTPNGMGPWSDPLMKVVA